MSNTVMAKDIGATDEEVPPHQLMVVLHGSRTFDEDGAQIIETQPTVADSLALTELRGSAHRWAEDIFGHYENQPLGLTSGWNHHPSPFPQTIIIRLTLGQASTYPGYILQDAIADFGVSVHGDINGWVKSAWPDRADRPPELREALSVRVIAQHSVGTYY